MAGHAVIFLASMLSAALAAGTPDCGMGTPCGNMCTPFMATCKNNKCFAMFDTPVACVPAVNTCGSEFCSKGTMCGKTGANAGKCIAQTCANYHDDTCPDSDHARDTPCPGGAHYDDCKESKMFKCAIGTHAIQVSCKVPGYEYQIQSQNSPLGDVNAPVEPTANENVYVGIAVAALLAVGVVGCGFYLYNNGKKSAYQSIA